MMRGVTKKLRERFRGNIEAQDIGQNHAAKLDDENTCEAIAETLEEIFDILANVNERLDRLENR